MGSADDLLWVSGLATLVMAMLVPEATRTLARRWPEGRLTGRLSARLLQANLTRACVLTAVPSLADQTPVQLCALAQAGIHPEQAWIYVEPEPLLPDLALVGSAAGLSLTMLLVAWASTRAQLLSLRPWVSRLTQLGVSKRWALRAVGTQYAAPRRTGRRCRPAREPPAPAGCPARPPGSGHRGPVVGDGVLLACLALTVGLGGVGALRSLTYAEGAEAQVTF